MRTRRYLALAALLALAAPRPLPAGDEFLAALDGVEPYAVGREAPRLETPQWVGEPGVEAVVILAIDDLGENSAKYEQFLRPILDRLKMIDGRAALSVMTNRVAPADPIAARWLAEGVNLDVHTLTHPCPLLQKGDFAAAAGTYHGGVDLLAAVPGNRPLAFRMPCCDSQNTPSPRFYAELFNRPSPGGRFLAADSSVFCVLTPTDPALPRELVVDPDGREKFRKYLPFPSFVNTIDDYPYPYVIGRLGWQFPCIVPSDWEAQNLQQPSNPRTVADMKAALDAVVIKRGVFCLVFHPHGWIDNTQVVELIDHAVARHGSKVKFLNFREAVERIEANATAGHALRAPDGGDNGVRLVDLDADGSLDVTIGNDALQVTRRWDRAAGRWIDGEFPTRLDGPRAGPIARGSLFGRESEGGPLYLLRADESAQGAWAYREGGWQAEPSLMAGLESADGSPPTFAREGRDAGARLRDLDGDGGSELIAPDGSVFAREAGADGWRRLPFALPEGARIARPDGLDGGARLVDLDRDGALDVIFSDGNASGAALFTDMKAGWSRPVPGADKLPPIARADGTNNGFWLHSNTLWWQNEDTADLPDKVDRRPLRELLAGVEPRARTPAQALRSFRVAPGFRVELMAAEPLVMDPIAFDWGADGALWVVEMADYPLGLDGKGRAGGRVVRLVDSDDDGRPDRRTVFLDGLPYPTGVIAWRRGVIVSCAPEVFYAEDADGDGRAEVRRPLLTGFAEGNPQHRVNGFAWGLDGWIYGGGSDGPITSAITGAVVEASGRDFRFRPDTGELEAESGRSQFGRRRDDAGRWFGNDNSTWAWHYVLADPDLRRNPSLALPTARHSVEPDSRLFPISPAHARFNDLWAAGLATSANSPEPARDDRLGPGSDRWIFVSEPVHNLVHRLAIAPDGPTVRGRRLPVEESAEFLASADPWFRPTGLRTGPDGALWIADMVRAVIEHPEWIPDDWEARIDLRAGHDRGRLWRVVPLDAPSPEAFDRLDGLDPAGLVAALDHPNGWRRDTAQRLLLDAADASVAPSLRTLARSATRTAVRLQALWTLRGLGALTTADVAIALSDPSPDVRRNALRAGASLLGDDEALAAALLARIDDPDAAVRLELASALAGWRDPRAGRALAALALRDGGDPWLRAAILAAAPPHAATMVEALFAEAGLDGPPAEVVGPLFALAAAEPSSLAGLLRRATATGPGRAFAPWQLDALAGLLDAARPALDDADPGDDLWDALQGLPPALDAARRTAADRSASEADRECAARLLGRDNDPDRRDAEREILTRLLAPQVPSRLQLAAIAAFERSGDPRAADAMLGGWRGHGPGLRTAILDALIGREPWAESLLSSLEDTCVAATDVGPAHRRRLLDHDDDRMRDRARALFATRVAPREQVVAGHRRLIAEAPPGDPAAGRAVFSKICAQCHRLDGEGFAVGPDLAALTDRSPEAMLVALLDPNRAVETRYASYTLATTDGRVLTGRIEAETGSSITLVRPGGLVDVVPRSAIEEVAAVGGSLMPEGLERDLEGPALADLLAYLAAGAPPPKEQPGNRPATVGPGPDGSYALTAATAAIYGPNLIFEPRYGNLGYWSSDADHAAWTVDLARAGRYEIVLDAACADDVAGNRYLLRAGGAELGGRVAGTGSWDDYRQVSIGTLDLPAGRLRVELRPDGPVRGALIDLRAIELRPAPVPCCGAAPAPSERP